MFVVSFIVLMVILVLGLFLITFLVIFLYIILKEFCFSFRFMVIFFRAIFYLLGIYIREEEIRIDVGVVTSFWVERVFGGNFGLRNIRCYFLKFIEESIRR